MSKSRKITLDAVMPEYALGVLARRVESTLPAGLRQVFLEAEPMNEDDAMESATITAGAGLGSPYLTCEVKMRDGSRREEIIDMRKVAQAWIAAIIEAGPTPEVKS